ncbi:MAG: RsmE family RNA methyltransferase [Ginsengibacter sp.]
MQPPFFFLENIPKEDRPILDEASSHHLSRVLRMKEGELIVLTDGKGNLYEAAITAAHKSKSEVRILEKKQIAFDLPEVTIAISPIKNVSRFEWFIEKCTELGVHKIIPVICSRTEKFNYKQERLQNILKSAIMQSRQPWMPQLMASEKIENLIVNASASHRFIAHCNRDENKLSLPGNIKKDESRIILIGPEGDFTEEEVNFAIAHKFIPITLGASTLRTETAGIAAAVLLKQNS